MRTAIFMGLLSIANATAPDNPVLSLKADLYMVIFLFCLLSDIYELFTKHKRK